MKGKPKAEKYHGDEPRRTASKEKSLKRSPTTSQTRSALVSTKTHLFPSDI